MERMGVMPSRRCWRPCCKGGRIQAMPDCSVDFRIASRNLKLQAGIAASCSVVKYVASVHGGSRQQPEPDDVGALP
eukprot:356172-Chlamydomonas_euryale.AAC.1